MTETSAKGIDAARAAGLRYTRSGGPGIRRRRAGKGWSFIGADGGIVRDPAVLGRIRALVIPPAWTDVWINPHPRGHIQATGRDARGRKQYLYHAKWRAARDETKFERLIDFGEALPAIRTRVEADLALPGLPREKTLATVVRLLEESLIRIGNAEYARENGSYGLTTLLTDHVAVTATRVHFVFRGKSGISHEIDVRDRRVASIIRRLQHLPGQPLFQYLDEDKAPQTIDSDDVNAYLHAIAGEEFTAKEFRTWAGTALACQLLRDRGPAETAAERKVNVIEVVDAVAERLGNTRAVCRASYVHPAILSGYENGALAAFTPRGRVTPLLTPDEWWTLEYLKEGEGGGGGVAALRG
jgi:DNA topoisomerase-1